MKPYVPSCEEEARYLAAYDPGKYQNPAVTADVALFGRAGERLFLLLIRRGGYPYKGYYALPGGFIDIAESVPAGAARELLEETGLAGLKLHECGVLSEPGRDPRQRVISVVYWAAAEQSALAPAAGDDAAAAEWFAFSGYSCQEQADGRLHRYTLSGRQTTTPRPAFGPIWAICGKTGRQKRRSFSIEIKKRALWRTISGRK